MRAFNTFQIVGAFTAWPWLIAWLSDAQFKGATAAFYASIVAYLFAFGFICYCVYEQTETKT
jgi:hypothetical protein